jgi:hypothetical protein
MNYSRLEKHIFVCTNERPPENPKGCCSAKGGHDIRLEGEVLPDLGPELSGTYNPDTLWWKHEKFHRSMLLDFPDRLAVICQNREEMEAEWVESHCRTVQKRLNERLPWKRSGWRRSVICR